MRTYIIPPSMKEEKEKIIGGILDITQAMWLFGSGVIGLLIFFILAPISKILGGIVGVLVAIPIAVVFGFLKIKGYSVIKYYKYKKQFDKKEKILINKRKLG